MQFEQGPLVCHADEIWVSGGGLKTNFDQTQLEDKGPRSNSIASVYLCNKFQIDQMLEVTSLENNMRYEKLNILKIGQRLVERKKNPKTPSSSHWLMRLHVPADMNASYHISVSDVQDDGGWGRKRIPNPVWRWL